MRIALIGMSGAGKSYWARRLAQTGFSCLGCDDAIGHELTLRLDLADGSIDGVGQWMGFPYEDGFHSRERLYLDLERRVLTRFLDTLENPAPGAADTCVIDTTGSVVYLGDELLTRLCRMSVVVYLSCPPARRQALLDAYRANPRPVVWQGMYRPLPVEDRSVALERCYRALVADRDRRYRRYAHLTVELPPPADGEVSLDCLLRPVQNYLDETDGACSC